MPGPIGAQRTSMRLTDSPNSTYRVPAPSRLRLLQSLTWLVALVALVFSLDRMTGLPHVQHLYYVPIIFAAIRFGMIPATAVAAVAILLYHVANPHALTWRYEESDLLQAAMFLGVGAGTAKLVRDTRRLHQLAMTDDLTGLHNLRSFESALRTMLVAARAAGTDVSLLVLDVDRLKSLNDTYGHLTGSEAVRAVGRIIADRIPPGATACRYGGAEFAIALPHCSSASASEAAEDLRRTVEATAPVLTGRQFAERTLSVSVGIACCSFASDLEAAAHAENEGEALFQRADAALYVAKNNGRNGIHAA